MWFATFAWSEQTTKCDLLLSARSEESYNEDCPVGPGNDTSHEGIGIDAQMREGAEQGSKTLCLLCRVATCI